MSTRKSALLIALGGPNRGMSWELRGTVGIGREGEIALSDPHLGRRQASLRWRGGRARIRHDGGANPTLLAVGPVRLACPARWVTIPPWVRIGLGSGWFRVLPQRSSVSRERRVFPLRALLPLALMAAMVPFVMGGPAWRWALLALPLLGMLALARTGGGRIRGRRRGHLPHQISQASTEGRAFHTEPVLPRRPRVLRSGDLRGTGWYTDLEGACWLAGFLAAHNDPDVLAIASPWVTTHGAGLTVRFEETARGGPSTDEVLVTWGGLLPGWAVPLRLPHGASPAWVRSLHRAVREDGIPDMVWVEDALYSDLVLARAWEKSGLSVRLGAGRAGDVVVDLVADGPHALVAGTTGAGKSELLTTWVLGLASAAPPSRLTLVLVDFKGGAAFGPLTGLPHCAAVLTDLDPGGTRRALASMRALLREREKVLGEAGCRDIAELEAARPGAMPRLIVVVDEFRALADDHPEILDQLLRLGAQGRSLGVHLIVATQRPAGAVGPDLRANMPLRLCLRVAEAGDSHDVLGSPAAAELPRIAGRALLGPDALQEFQVAWSGEPANVGAAVEAIQVAAGSHVRGELPWQPPLPAKIPASAAGPDVVAVADLPEDLTRRDVGLPGTGLLVVGPPRSGRTLAALRMAAAALEKGDETWVVTADRQMLGGWGAERGGIAEAGWHAEAGRGAEGGGIAEGGWGADASWGAERGLGVAVPGDGVSLFGGCLAVTEVRLVWALLQHAAEAPGRTVVLDDVELWMAAHDHLHGVGEAAGLLGSLQRSIVAAGSRLVVTGGAETVGARWSAPLPRTVLAGTDEATAMLSGVPRALVNPLPSPGRGVWMPEGWEVQFVLPPAGPPLLAGSARRFTPLPPPAVLHAEDGRVVLGVGGNAVGADSGVAGVGAARRAVCGGQLPVVSVAREQHIVVIGLGEERERAHRLITGQRPPEQSAPVPPGRSAPVPPGRSAPVPPGRSAPVPPGSLPASPPETTTPATLSAGSSDSPRPVTLAVTPSAWATGWSGDLGRVRESAAVLVVRPDIVGQPSGLRISGELEPGGVGYAVLVVDGVATALRLAERVLGAADPG